MNWVSCRLYIGDISVVYRLLVIEPLYNGNISLVIARTVGIISLVRSVIIILSILKEKYILYILLNLIARLYDKL